MSATLSIGLTVDEIETAAAFRVAGALTWRDIHAAVHDAEYRARLPREARDLADRFDREIIEELRQGSFFEDEDAPSHRTAALLRPYLEAARK